jgi:hypothetical protein
LGGSICTIGWGAPTYEHIHICWGVPQPTTYEHMDKPRSLAFNWARFGQTEADFCLRFGLRGNRIFGSETEEEALRRSRAEHRFCGVSRKFVFSNTQS